jgi:plasmid replication initiation protein
MPEHGMATIWDADVLIWAASQLVAAANLGLTTSRFFRFTPYQLLRGVGRSTGNQQYLLLKAALARLQSTVIATTIRHGAHWRRQQFSWINEWGEMSTSAGRIVGMEFVLPEWFYRGVLDRSLVLAIDPAYFRLTGGIERWLYRVARKHAGRQPSGWLFEIAHLHAKSGSLARISDFALDLRRIAARQPLPGYRLMVERDGRSERLRILPADLSTGRRNLARSPADRHECHSRLNVMPKEAGRAVQRARRTYHGQRHPIRKARPAADAGGEARAECRGARLAAVSQRICAGKRARPRPGGVAGSAAFWARRGAMGGIPRRPRCAGSAAAAASAALGRTQRVRTH